GEKVRWVSATKVPITDQNGRGVGIVGISRDITERIIAEEALRTAKEKLEAWVKELERRNGEMALLSEMTEPFQACYTLDEAYAVIVRIASRLFAAEPGQLGILNDSRDAVEVVAHWGPDEPSRRIFEPDACWALRRGRPHRVEDSAVGLGCRHLGDPPP